MTARGRNTTTQELARMTLESYRVAFGSLAAMQESYMKLVRHSTGMFLWGARRQQEIMGAMLFGGPARSVAAPHRAPVAENGTEDLPVEDYDRLSVGEITGELSELSAGEVEELREHETKNQNRPTLVERFDRSLV